MEHDASMQNRKRIINNLKFFNSELFSKSFASGPGDYKKNFSSELIKIS